jgi:hypothetical protein
MRSREEIEKCAAADAETAELNAIKTMIYLSLSLSLRALRLCRVIF